MMMIHPSVHFVARLFTRENVRDRCHNRQVMGSDQCAPHHAWCEAHLVLEAQRQGLVPSRNRHDATDLLSRIPRWIAGYETADQRVSIPGAGLSPRSWTLEDVCFEPEAHRFMNFVCVPIVTASHTRSSGFPKSTSSTCVVQLGIIFSTGFLLEFLLDDGFSLDGFLDDCRFSASILSKQPPDSQVSR